MNSGAKSMNDLSKKQNEPIPAIYGAMSAIMAEIDFIGKEQKNTQQGFRYRGIDDIYNSLHRLFAKHGVFVTPEVLEKVRQERETIKTWNGEQKKTILAFTCLRMKYTFYAQDGSSISCTVEGEGMDAGDKSSNKAMAVAHKYALLQVFMIPTDEVKDPDAESHEVIGQMSGQPLDVDKVSFAVDYIKKVIDADIPEEERTQKLKMMDSKLDNDEKIALGNGLQDKAPGTRRKYNNIYHDYLKEETENG